MQEKNIKIVKPSGENEYKLLVSFELNNSQYIVVDSKEKDANLNTVVYISRVDGNELVNVVDENENVIATTDFTDESKNLRVWKAVGLQEEDFYKQ